MNLLTAARERMAELRDLLQHTSNARMAAAARRSPLPQPAATRIEVRGMGMVRICDANTGRVLGFRDSYREAQWLAAALERGEAQGAA